MNTLQNHCGVIYFILFHFAQVSLQPTETFNDAVVNWNKIDAPAV
jgi:hypothetical protein